MASFLHFAENRRDPVWKRLPTPFISHEKHYITRRDPNLSLQFIPILLSFYPMSRWITASVRSASAQLESGSHQLEPDWLSQRKYARSNIRS